MIQIKKIELLEDLLKMIINKNYNVDLANLQDTKLEFEISKEMYFDEKPLGLEGTRDKSLIRLLRSPAIMASRDIHNIFNRKT